MLLDGIIYLIVFAILTLVLLVAISVLFNEKGLKKLTNKISKKVRE